MLVAAWALALEVVEGGWAMAEAEAVVAAVAAGGRREARTVVVVTFRLAVALVAGAPLHLVHGSRAVAVVEAAVHAYVAHETARVEAGVAAAAESLAARMERRVDQRNPNRR